MSAPAPPTAVRIAASADDLARAAAVMAELRTHLAPAELARRMAAQQASGYEVAIAERDGAVVAVAGFRVGENLAWGRHIYVDDLVTAGAQRGTGAGQALFEWLVARARDAGCAELHLDSGVQRFGAHAFYLARGMRISSHHFALDL